MTTRPFNKAEYDRSVAAGKPLPVVTKRSQTPVRIICTDAPGEQCVVGIRGETIEQWFANGVFYDKASGGLDLRFAAPREITDAEVDQFVEEAFGDGGDIEAHAQDDGSFKECDCDDFEEAPQHPPAQEQGAVTEWFGTADEGAAAHIRCAFPESLCHCVLCTAVGEQIATLRTERDEAVRERERLEVQLAGCGVAATGWSTGEQRAKQGDYGWSLAYQDVLKLREHSWRCFHCGFFTMDEDALARIVQYKEEIAGEEADHATAILERDELQRRLDALLAGQAVLLQETRRQALEDAAFLCEFEEILCDVKLLAEQTQIEHGAWIARQLAGRIRALAAAEPKEDNHE